MQYLTQAQLTALQAFDTPTICNAIEAFGLRGRTEGFTSPGLVLRTAPDTKPMVGYARTGIISASTPAEPVHCEVMERYYRQYENFDLPQIAVIQELDALSVGSFWGDVQATVHKALGCVGAITDGGVRDLVEVEKLGFYLFSKEILISHGYIHMVQAATTVTIFGMQVEWDALIHADYHGAIVIPHEIADKLAIACQRAIEAEEALRLPCHNAMLEGKKITATEIMTWRDDMQKKRASIWP